jgi:hypothetical protein
VALIELFAADRATATVSSGGTDAPSSGTAETWTVASSSMFGAAVTGVSQFHVADPAAPSEVIAVTNVTGLTWTVTRGADSTATVTHAAGFTVYQVAASGWLGGLAQLASPAFTGTPTAPTAAALTASTRLATTAYADSAVGVETARAETAEALKAPLASPALTGTPTAPTATALTDSTQLATTAYADAAVAVETGRAEAAEALLAPKASPALTGNPTAPTQSLSDNTTKIATTAYVTGAVAAAGGGTVTSVTAADTSVVVGGTSAAPTVRTATLDVIAADHPAAADWSNNSHKITSLANGSSAQDAAAFGQIPASLPPSGSAGGDLGSSYPSPTVTSTHLASPLPLAQGGTGVNAASDAALLADLGAAPLASPALTGTPTAPTATALTDSTQVATTAYADSAVAVETTRAEAAEVLKAPLASPALTGSPTAPTQTTGDASTKIATDAFVTTAVAAETTRAETAEALLAPLASAALTGNPTAPTQAAGDSSTKLATTAFVAAAVAASAAGLSVKPSVQEATAAALPANTYLNGSSGAGATLTGTATGVLTVDGIAVALNDRVLVQNEASASRNGIYACTLAGALGAAYILTRAADMNTAAQVPGAFCFCEQGTANAGAGFTVASEGPFTIGTTAIPWTQFSGAGEITAGTGLGKTGNTLNLSTPVSLANGGTGASAASSAALLTALGAAPLASPALTGTPAAPTASALTSSTQLATTAYADSAVAAETSRAEAAEALLAPLASPALTGNPTAPTQTTGDASTKIATDAFVGTAVAAETTRAEAAEAALSAITPYLCTPTQYAPGTRVQFTTASATMAAVSSANINTGAFTAPPSGSVLVTASFVWAISASGYPGAFALAAHGTVTPLVSNVTAFQNNTQPIEVAFQFLVTGLAAGTAYNFDLMFSSPSGAGYTVAVDAQGGASTTPGTTSGGPVVMAVQAVGTAGLAGAALGKVYAFALHTPVP